MNIILKTNHLIIAFSIGLGLFFTVYFMILFKTIKENKSKFSLKLISNTFNKNRHTRNIKRTVNKFIKNIFNLTKKEKYLIWAVVLLMLGMVKSIRFLFFHLILGLVIGLFVVGILKKIKKDMNRTKKLREVVTLFEGIEIYLKAGYSLMQSLRASKLFTNYITPSIDKCLSYWSMGPQKALEILKQELNLEETDSLILLMMHLESAGVKDLQGMLQREAHNIDRLQRMKVELKIAHRPLVLLVYKILPIAAILGIIVGSLLYRMFLIFSNMRLF